MANYAVFFAGSDQSVYDSKHVYSDWARELSRSRYNPILCDGCGKFPGTSGSTGSGWAKIVQHAMDAIAGYKAPPVKVIIVGMSRGGVQALILAHCIRAEYPNAKCFVFAVDPVQGAHIQNASSFDLSEKRNVFRSLFNQRGSRDDLKDRYSLGNAAPNTIPDNVDFYLTALMQFKGKSRKFWGFTPQAPSLGNINGLRLGRHATYEIPGDHGYGVYTGLEEGKELNGSRYSRGRVTREMFAHHCLEHGYGRVQFDDIFSTLNHYCRIANEDLMGSQGQSKATGFSFLKQSRAARTFGSPFSNPSASHGWAAGRGHIVASTQAIAHNGYFVNDRHHRIFMDLEPIIAREITAGRNDLFQNYQEIPPWFQANARFALDAGEDRRRFAALLAMLENF